MCDNIITHLNKRKAMPFLKIVFVIGEICGVLVFLIILYSLALKSPIPHIPAENNKRGKKP